MKVRMEIGLLSVTVGFGWRYRFGYDRRNYGATAGFGIGWARWIRRMPVTGRRLSVRVVRRREGGKAHG